MDNPDITNYIERLKQLETAMSEIQEQKIREDERNKLKKKWLTFAWDMAKSVLVPLVVCAAMIHFTR